MDSPQRIELTAIGIVSTDVPPAQIGRRRRELISMITVDPALAPALTGLEEYSHLIVLFWMDRAPAMTSLMQRPRGDPSQPAKGALAMRTRNRPNPIGLAVVDLIERVENRLLVRRLDAYDGTPVIDIKPYDHYDVFTAIRVPSWSNSARDTPPA